MLDTLRNEWSKSSCSSNQQVKVLNGSPHATCICYKLGILSVVSIELLDLSFNNNSVSNRTEPSNFASGMFSIRAETFFCTRVYVCAFSVNGFFYRTI